MSHAIFYPRSLFGNTLATPGFPLYILCFLSFLLFHGPSLEFALSYSGIILQVELFRPSSEQGSSNHSSNRPGYCSTHADAFASTFLFTVFPFIVKLECRLGSRRADELI